MGSTRVMTMGPTKFSTSNGDDIQADSIVCNRVDQLRRTDEILLQQLIDIDEEMGSDDLELLKFVLRDHIGGSKLEAMTSPLDLFHRMQKLFFLTPDDVDLLIESLRLIHRVDLIRKLGFDMVDRVIEGGSQSNRISAYRKLLLAIAEDLDDTELSKMKFLLSGKIPKKHLHLQKTALQLFVYLEQEHLIAPQKTELLADLVKNIKRTDLVHKIKAFLGQTTRSVNQLSGPLPRIHDFHEPQIERLVPIRSGTADQLNGEPHNVPVTRSPSAGTLSVSSSEENLQRNGRDIQIPSSLIEEIVVTVARENKWMDFAMELGFTNEEIGVYEANYSDRSACVRKALDDWSSKLPTNREIAPKLLYVLTSLNMKNQKDKLMQWQDISANSQQRVQQRVQTQDHAVVTSIGGSPRAYTEQEDQNINFTVNAGSAGVPQFIPAGPPPEIQHTSLQSARPMPPDSPMRNPAQGDVQIVDLQSRLNAMTMGQQQAFQPYMANQPLMMPQQMPQAGAPVVSAPIQSDVGMIPPRPAPSTNQVPRPNGAAVVNLPEFLEYPMSQRPRGWCIIINNRDFTVIQSDAESKEMPQRTGTDVDAESLQHVFETLGFIVRRRDNLTEIEMMQFLIDMAHNVDHTKFECFVCCILTHGVLNHLYGSNGRLVSIKDLTSMFQANRCPSLAGKPKLFFLQACQGRDKMSGGEAVRNLEMDARGLRPRTSDMERDAHTETDSDKEMIPNEADFVIGYATVPGYVSFRSRTHGSWYIRKLCELLEKHSHRDDLMSILIQVNYEVSRANANIDNVMYKQTPAPLVTLRKKLYFR